ncbi:class I SAM-dependent methyltransferase [Erythrobacter crassostreae]|uniref:Class I SAM-dependent methyltransferase n=1 Tax=Erythrobacter crassostreae TaxID=2828328 RepID=A0A9X1F294_9SPHN|nr:methyltransferase [Erythrobacter crassostrea]MBV7258976.1 class I SAM-dependent methyltransferase [Erythrobacter crassostrea]
MKHILMAAAAVLTVSACAPEADETGPAEASVENTKLTEVLADARRDEDRARDEFRNPAETLAFFQVEPSHTVIEYAPGGGWYTRVLAPYVSEEGSYVAVSFPPEAASSLGDEFVERVRGFSATFSADQSESTGLPAEALPFHFGNAIPEELNGTVDRVLMIRMMHNLIRWGVADSEVEALHAALKPGGMLGVVQHRAKADASDEYVDGNMGYLKQAELVAYFEGKGFELVDTSEINANANDTAGYENGVWTLPPSYAKGDEDRETYAAIGESDRMTLLFQKPE